MGNSRMLKYNSYSAYKLINEGIFDFLNNDNGGEINSLDTGVDQLKKVESEVLNNYNLSKEEEINIKAKIEDAISKKSK